MDFALSEVDFEFDEESQFEKVGRLLAAMQGERRKQHEQGKAYEKPPIDFWLGFFDERDRDFFWWPEPAEEISELGDDWSNWKDEWDRATEQERWHNPRLRRPWTLQSLIEAFEQSTYVLEEIRRVQQDGATIRYEPFIVDKGHGWIEAMVEAFGCRVVSTFRASEPSWFLE